METEEALEMLKKNGFVRAFARKTGTPEQTVYTWRRKRKIPVWRLPQFDFFAANDNGTSDNEPEPDNTGAA